MRLFWRLLELVAVSSLLGGCIMSTLRIISAVLGRCFLIFVAMLCLSVGMVYCCHDWAYSIHSQIFPTLTVEAFEMTIYQMLGHMKALTLVLFLIPWLAIQLVLRNASEGDE